MGCPEAVLGAAAYPKMENSMDFRSRLNVLKTITAARVLGTRTPLACHFAITNRCPWNCVYCAFSKLDRKECTTEEAIGIINALADMGNQRLHLVGGEPLVRKDVGELVAAAKARGLYVTMATTGVYLKKMWRRVKDVDIFFLSFDGPRKIHDSQRGDGAYDVLMEAIATLKEKKKRFWTTTVLTGQNIDQIDFIMGMALEKGFLTNFHLLYFTGTDDYLPGAIHHNDLDGRIKADQRQYHEILDRLMALKRTRRGDVIASSPSYFKVLRQWGDFSQVYRPAPSPHYRCWAGKLYCYIDANGDLYPCGDVMGRVRPVNCLENGFEHAFSNLAPVPCRSCIIACYTELNLMFSLNLTSVWNWNRKV